MIFIVGSEGGGRGGGALYKKRLQLKNYATAAYSNDLEDETPNSIIFFSSYISQLRYFLTKAQKIFE